MSRPGSRPRSKCILIAARLSYFYLFDRHLIFILIAAVGPCRRAQEGERSLACGVGLSFGAQNASPPMSHHMSSSEHTASSRARTQRALCSDQSGHAGGRITRGEALICTLHRRVPHRKEGRNLFGHAHTGAKAPSRRGSVTSGCFLTGRRGARRGVSARNAELDADQNKNESRAAIYAGFQSLLQSEINPSPWGMGQLGARRRDVRSPAADAGLRGDARARGATPRRHMC